jgi:drug/metabolite transporter (DMT)-like permease
VAGVTLVRYSGDMSWQRMEGLRWGLVAMFFFAFNDLTNKRATMADAPVFPTLALMFVTGAALFGAWWLIDKARARRRSAAASDASAGVPVLPGKPWGERKTYLWGMAVGLTHVSGMIFIYRAFGAGVTGLVSAVAALNVVMILLYARLVVKERFRPFELAGIGLSLAGMMVLHLFG